MLFVFTSNDEHDTDRFGAALAQVLPPGAVVALIGTLGAGKTRLVQAVAKAVGIDPHEVVSPTFVLVHEYTVSPGREAGATPKIAPIKKMYHLDAYRIKDDDEFLQLGPEEYFESDGWTFVEWADRVEDCLPREHLRVEIEVTGPTQRRLSVSAWGERMKTTIDQLLTILPT